jgi:hypothetical protein
LVSGLCADMSGLPTMRLLFLFSGPEDRSDGGRSALRLRRGRLLRRLGERPGARHGGPDEVRGAHVADRQGHLRGGTCIPAALHVLPGTRSPSWAAQGQRPCWYGQVRPEGPQAEGEGVRPVLHAFGYSRSAGGRGMRGHGHPLAGREPQGARQRDQPLQVGRVGQDMRAQRCDTQLPRAVHPRRRE